MPCLLRIDSIRLVMKQLPDEKELAELVEMARIHAEKAKAMSEFAFSVAQKYQKRMHDIRVAVIQQQEA